MTKEENASEAVPRRRKSNQHGGNPVTLSAIDSSRFSVVVARSQYLTGHGLREANAFCRSHGVDLLITRCPTTDAFSIRNLEADGFRLMDTLVYWRRALATPIPPSHDGPFPIRTLSPSDAEAASALAKEAFSNYDGHYHADTRLARAACTEVYASWAGRCCSEIGVADVTLGAEFNQALAGLVALKRIDASTYDLMLAAVRPSAQGQGIFRELIVRAMQMLQELNFRVVEYSCVLTNIGAQKTLARLGFEIDRSCHTFHKWYS